MNIFINRVLRSVRLGGEFLCAICAGPAIVLMQYESMGLETLPEAQSGQPSVIRKLFFTAAAACAYYLVQFLLPVVWWAGILFHFVSGTAVYMFFRRIRPGFRLIPSHGVSGEKPPVSNSLWAGFFLIMPPVFLIAFLNGVFNLALFSVRDPSGVFSDSFLWMAAALPVVMLAAAVLRGSGVIFGFRHILYYYCALGYILVFLIAAEHFRMGLIEASGISLDTPLLFSAAADANYRQWVDIVLILAGASIILPYVVMSAGIIQYCVRMLLSGPVLALLMLNIAMISGEWNCWYSILQRKALNQFHYGTWETFISLQCLRVPASFGVPFILERQADYRAQSGRGESAIKIYRQIQDRFGRISYYGEIAERAAGIIENSERYQELPGRAGLSVFPEVPIIKREQYLSPDWYGVLSAVSFIYPGLTDLPLKEKLLEIISPEDHVLPLINNIPVLVPVLNRLSVPHSTVFLSESLLVRALKGGRIPLVFLNSGWTPLVGFDARRGGFLYYDYASGFESGERRMVDDDAIIFSRPAGGGAGKTGANFKYAFQAFISSRDLNKHMLDIGGIGVIIGDSVMVPAAERRSAYLIELGDIYYQEQNNFESAARCYREARELHESWTVRERMQSLIQVYRQRCLRLKGPVQLFGCFSDEEPEWTTGFGGGREEDDQTVSRILSGKAGRIILEQWPVRTSYRSSGRLDTAVLVYRRLHQEAPFHLPYLDSLARLEYEQGHLDSSEACYRNILAGSARPQPEAGLRLAWLKLLQGKTEEIAPLLEDGEEAFGPARFKTLEAAVFLERGKTGAALKKLEESLKISKTIPQTHQLMARCFDVLGNKERRDMHLRWYRRCRQEVLP